MQKTASVEVSRDFSSHRITQVRMEHFDQHNEIEIAILDAGSLQGVYGGVLRRTPPRTLVCGWAMIPHRALDSDCICYVLHLPLSWFMSWLLPRPFVDALLRGTWFLDPQADHGEEDVRSFQRWHGDIGSGDERRKRAALLEIEARLLRLALDIEHSIEQGRKSAEAESCAPPRSQATDAELGNVERIAAYIARHYQENVKIAEMAHEIGLHEKYAMQLFRRACGVTVWQYLTQHRLWHAQRLLVTSSLPMIEIAYEAGFGSGSQFYAVFRRHCGLSPRQYRASTQSPEPPRQAASRTENEPDKK